MILIKTVDFLFKPFYTYLCVFPFSLKAGKHAVYKQLQYLHFKLTRKYRKGPLVVTVMPGIANCKMEIVPGKDFHQMCLFMTRFYEKEMTKAILSDMFSGAVFIDAGAYLGYYSLVISSMFTNVKVYAFEPQKTAYERFKKNITINDLKNIEVYNCALADVNDTKPIYINGFPEQSSLHQCATQQESHYNVELKRLDDLFTVKGEKIVVKIDTEGYEFEVLKGMTEIMKNNECTIYFEFNPQIYNRQYGNGYSELLLDFIHEMGFRIYEIGTKGRLKDFIFNPEKPAQKNLVIKTT